MIIIKNNKKNIVELEYLLPLSGLGSLKLCLNTKGLYGYIVYAIGFTTSNKVLLACKYVCYQCKAKARSVFSEFYSTKPFFDESVRRNAIYYSEFPPVFLMPEQRG